MDLSQQVATSSEPPSSSVEVSFPVRAFGYDTSRYRTLLEALVNGMWLYETTHITQRNGGSYAATPIPVA